MPPLEWAKHGRSKIVEALDLYEVPPLARPAAVGFALQRAIDEGREVLDPLMAAKIAIECSVRWRKWLRPVRLRHLGRGSSFVMHDAGKTVL